MSPRLAGPIWGLLALPALRAKRDGRMMRRRRSSVDSSRSMSRRRPKVEFVSSVGRWSRKLVTGWRGSKFRQELWWRCSGIVSYRWRCIVSHLWCCETRVSGGCGGHWCSQGILDDRLWCLISCGIFIDCRRSWCSIGVTMMSTKGRWNSHSIRDRNSYGSRNGHGCGYSHGGRNRNWRRHRKWHWHWNAHRNTHGGWAMKEAAQNGRTKPQQNT